MKYRHGFHAGNFADVHKHVTQLALLAALERKDKGFLYLDTHAGRGSYDLSSPSPEAAAGIGRFVAAEHTAPELREYASLLARFRARPGHRHFYPGSPLIAALELRPQDRAVLIELAAAEAPALVSELWLYPRDSRVGLNGSGLLIANPPYLTLERMQVWLPELQRCLAAGPAGGTSVRVCQNPPNE